MRFEHVIQKTQAPGAKILRGLKIDDVSSVEVGAGRGVQVKLLKRHRAGDIASEMAALPDDKFAKLAANHPPALADDVARAKSMRAVSKREVSFRREGGTVSKGSVTMSGKKTMKCPSCGAEHDEDAFSKAMEAGEVVLAKAQRVVFDSIVKDMMGEGMTRREATAAVAKGSPAGGVTDHEKAINDAHRAERKMRLGW